LLVLLSTGRFAIETNYALSPTFSTWAYLYVFDTEAFVCDTNTSTREATSYQGGGRLTEMGSMTEYAQMDDTTGAQGRGVAGLDVGYQS
jgi:hypothetical protein